MAKSKVSATLNVGAVGGEPEGVDLPLAPLGPEADAPVLLGPGVFLVDESSARGAAAVLGHPGEHPVGAVVVVERVSVVAAVDVVRDPGPPAVAVVGVVIREDVVAIVEVRFQMIAGARRNDLDARAVGKAAYHSAPLDLDRPAVGAGRVRNPLVAGRNIEVAIDAELKRPDDVVIEAAIARSWPRSLKRSLRHDRLCRRRPYLLQDGQKGHVGDIKLAVVPGHAEDGAEALGEDDRIFALAKDENTAVVGFIRADLVHRVFGDVKRCPPARWRPGRGTARREPWRRAAPQTLRAPSVSRPSPGA